MISEDCEQRKCHNCKKVKHKMAFKGYSMYCRLCHLYLPKELKDEDRAYLNDVQNKLAQEKYWKGKTRIRKARKSISEVSA